jgi:hypothetical protein
VGTASVRTVGDEAVADVHYWMDMPEGRAAFEVVKRLGAAAEWSWSSDVLDQIGEELERCIAATQELLRDGDPGRHP